MIWDEGVRGDQVLPLINLDVATLRVQAGPGTGKTFGLRRRVLRLVHGDGLGLEPETILVCSFNRAIAAELAAELKAELAAHGLAAPEVKTVHRLAMGLLGQSHRFLLPHETEAMVYDIRHRNTSLDNQYGRRQRVAMRALREHEAGLKNHPELAEAAQRWLADHGAQLVGDLPRRADRAIADGFVETPRFAHVIVDEFQDLTDGEARLLLRLREEGGSFVALGDRKQSIYAFRGNAQRGLAALPDLVEGAIVDLTMDECQRCYKEVVDIANAVMATENEPLQPVRGPGGQVHVLHFKTPEAETKHMAKEVVRVFKARPDKRHLVLVTRRKWGYALRAAISAEDSAIDVQTIYGEDILETWPAREAFIFLSLLANADDAAALRAWVGYRTVADGRDFKAPDRNAAAYCALWMNSGVLTLDRVLELSDLQESDLAGAGRRILLERLKRFRDLWNTTDKSAPVEELVQSVLDPTHWVTFQNDLSELARADLERLRAEVMLLLEELETPTLHNLIAALRSRIATREPLGMRGAPDIRIVTLWSAKGLTADFVYLVGLVDEALPGSHDPESTGLSQVEHVDEQRRLLYVSLTRAKESLVITRSSLIRLGQVPALGLSMPKKRNKWWAYLTPCRFLGDLSEELLAPSIAGIDWNGVQL